MLSNCNGVGIGFVDGTVDGAGPDTGEPLAKKESASIVAGRKAVEAKDFKSAVGHFTKAVDTEPKNADAYSMLGYSYRKTGTFDKSLEFYQKALKLDAHHRGAREYLGELIST